MFRNANYLDEDAWNKFFKAKKKQKNILNDKVKFLRATANEERSLLYFILFFWWRKCFHQPKQNLYTKM